MTIKNTLRSIFVRSPLQAIAFMVIGFSLLQAPSSYAAKQTASSTVTINKVSINSASAEVIADSLTGIGLKKAEAIISYRKVHGKFKRVEDLALVKGIGSATIEKNRTKLSL